MQPVGHGFLEVLLHLHGSSAIQRDLHKDAVVGSINAKKLPVKLQAGLGMLGDDLEEIVFGSVHYIGQRAIDDQTNLFAVLRGFACSEIDSNQRHAVSFDNYINPIACRNECRLRTHAKVPTVDVPKTVPSRRTDGRDVPQGQGACVRTAVQIDSRGSLSPNRAQYELDVNCTL